MPAFVADAPVVARFGLLDVVGAAVGAVALAALDVVVDVVGLGALAGADLAGVDLAGVDLAGVDLAGVDLVGVDFAAAGFAAVVLAEALLAVLEAVAPDVEAELLAARFAGAAEEPRVDVDFLPEAVVGDAVSASSAAGLAGLVTAAPADCWPEAAREEPGLPRRSAAARAIAPAMS